MIAMIKNIRENWEFVLILLLATFLRIYRIEENLIFHAEIGSDYLVIKDSVFNGNIPFLGPPTSHSWLSFGPLFYWIFAPVLYLWKFNPVGGAYFIAISQILGIALNYLIVSRILNKGIATLSSLLIAISPQWLFLARESRFFSLVTVFLYPTLYYFLLKRNLFWTGFWFGVMLNFHYSPIILILPGILILIRDKKSYGKKNIVEGIFGFLIPNLPFILYNLKTDFSMLAKFIFWIPYRIAGFLGIAQGNNFTIGVFKNNLFSLAELVTKTFIQTNSLWIILAFLVIFLYMIFMSFRQKGPIFNIALLFIGGYLGIFIHGSPPWHYFLALYPLLIIIFSHWLWRAYLIRKDIICVVIIVIFLINFRYFFSNRWFFISQEEINDIERVPYKIQLQVANEIKKDARSQTFVLRRVGSFDYYQKDFAQNYIYLLWWMGNEPQLHAKTKYTIFEESPNIPANKKGLLKVGNIVILKEDL